MKLKSAFSLNLMMIAFFVLNALLFDVMLFWIIAFVYTMLLPACSRKT